MITTVRKVGGLASKAVALGQLIVDRPPALGALLTWPRFSLTSYRMIDDLRRQGIRPATILDVGANQGQFACASLRLLDPRELHVFEPLPSAIKGLRDALGRDPRIVMHPVALGSAPARLPLQVNAHSHSSSLLQIGSRHLAAFPESTTQGEVMVEVRTLDDELAGHPLADPVLLKLDVQGYERQVLEGARETLRTARWLVVEMSFAPLYQGEPTWLELIEYVVDRGFSFLRPVSWLVAPGTGEILQCDGLFERSE